MQTTAVILREPRCVGLGTLALTPPKPGDVTVALECSAISTGTERLLFEGTMPAFPGMGYPLVPGYEGVGRVIAAAEGCTLAVGERVFVPGAQCFEGARGLFGASASRLVVPEARVLPVTDALGDAAVLLALAATARHTFSRADAPDHAPPELIVGHGALGRLLARIVLAMGHPAPLVWETDGLRRGGAEGYAVLDPRDDPRRDYRAITDCSGDPAVLDQLIARLAPGGEITLAGFYKEPVSFGFPAAFMREARLRVAAQWQRPDLELVGRLAASGALRLDDLVTHRADAGDAAEAYATAFADPACLKMVLDWRSTQ